ncbi:L-histidine N(alpha)-methyltransferase [Bordetella sp. 02P26C-1]|uniref:L-histidine N(alpha)-methyltransferase n=1 Tax=Bordetella sp. 02P26C-1 TaxID=2683195 RepID=UPI0013554BCD|nr:L-histidine N(alpha)-methyltransferase [Bordetella sp. 02P26C-1]MVW80106.1 L-histidine N(alpha)-methyltransferase [Bordetella sp. 02P26C-1]
MVQPRSMLASTPVESLIPPHALASDKEDRPADLDDALQAGLLDQPAHIVPKYLYDTLGSSLFTAITQLPEYYPTRCEAEILQDHADEIARHVGQVQALIDLGAGDCDKAEKLFPLLRPESYVPIDISVDFLLAAVERLRHRHPSIRIHPVGQDFHQQALSLPEHIASRGRLFFYPGSSIGNLDPAQAQLLLSQVCSLCPGGGLLIGVDRVKSRDILEPAYDDALHLTAAFNLNLLRHVNLQLGSDFDVQDWKHVAVYDEAHSRIQMFLQAQADVVVNWPGGQRSFSRGERIHTENSYKYTPENFTQLLMSAGFTQIQHWTDSRGWFSVYSARSPESRH